MNEIKQMLNEAREMIEDYCECREQGNESPSCQVCQTGSTLFLRTV
jgi:hypothetical protein